MITVSTERIVRETAAPYEHLVKGEVKTDSIRVRYYSETWNEMQERHKQLKQLELERGEDAIVWPHEVLADRLESLPDLRLPGGKPFKITPENLGTLEKRNLVAIRKAIDEDIEGKSQ